MMQKTYRAQSTIEIVPFHEKITSFDPEDERRYLSYNWDDTRKFYETQYKVLNSQALGAIIFQTLESDEYFNKKDKAKDDKKGFLSVIRSTIWGFWPGSKKNTGEILDDGLSPEMIEAHKQLEQEAKVKDFMSGLEIIPDRKSRLVDIAYESTDPRFSATVVNTLVQKYQKWNILKKQESTEVAGEFLQVQLDEAMAELERSEQELIDYARKVDIVSLDDAQNILLVELEEINRTLAKTETERLTKEALYKEIEVGNYEFLPKVVDDPAILELKSSYTELKAEYENKSVVFGPNFPEIKQLQAQLNKIQSEIDKRVEGIAASIKKDYQASLRTRKPLASKSAGTKQTGYGSE